MNNNNNNNVLNDHSERRTRHSDDYTDTRHRKDKAAIKDR